MESGKLYNFLSNRPSLFSYEDELELIDIMINTSIEWIENNQKEFLYALSELSICHTVGNGFLLEPEKDDIIFENFCAWLVHVNKNTNVPTLKFINDFSPDALCLKEFRKNKPASIRIS
jgi:hypothetical protein